MKLTDREIRHIDEALEEIGVDYDAVRQQYRGRCQSEPCFGIIMNNATTAQEFFVQLAILDSDLAEALVSSCSHDQMGKRTITYFPGYTII